MYQRVKLPDGTVIIQAENNHISVRQHGRLVLHINNDKDLTADELIQRWEDAKVFVE